MSKVFFYKYDPIKFERSFPNYIMKIFLFGDIEIRLKNYETMSTIDNLLWRMPETSFLPHEIISDNLNVIREDFEVCIETQKNYKSGAYTPGPLSPRHEQGVAYFQSQLMNSKTK